VRRFAAALLLVAGACGPGHVGDDVALEGLSLYSIAPDVIVKGTVIVLEGNSFVDSPWGTSVLRLKGTFTGQSGTHDVDVVAPARFVDYGRMEVDADDALFADLGGDGDFAGDVSVEVESAVDGKMYRSGALYEGLTLSSQLQPRLDNAQTGGVIFVNDRIAVEGGGFLLGGPEGTTYAVVQGCYTLRGESNCAPVGPVEVPLVPESAYDRSRGTFAFVPKIAGILPGTFAGTVALKNAHSAGPSLTSGTRDIGYELVEPAIFSVSPTQVSLGQYVDISGGGFVGGETGSDTLLHLDGTYTPTGAPSGNAVDMLLVPEFVEGREVRYVLNEDDALGQALDLRQDTGSFSGSLSPIVSYASDEVTGSATSMSFSIAPVKQVVYVNFLPTYVESLRHFGLRAVDARIRDRVRETFREAYDTINLEVREEIPTDFALFSKVDVGGPDPNGLGLFGYDNSPGKDTGNLRLWDRIGGVNAETQEDGYPGFGGIFIESLFGFSEHPEGRAAELPGSDPIFDDIFDPFRPDRGGDPVTAADLAGDAVPVLTSGDSCPAEERSGQIACAVWVIGSMIGSTVAHEVGHSLGLSNPYGDGFHNIGDLPNRLMEAGSGRPFLERAELYGQGPAVFCDDEYAYLRQILPTSDPTDPRTRPSCY